MLIKKGDIYRNLETNISCFIQSVKGDDCVVVWCFKSDRGVKLWGRDLQSWEQVIEGPDGYMEYRVTKKRADVLNEIAGSYLKTEAYGYEDKFIINWIPQHFFIAV